VNPQVVSSVARQLAGLCEALDPDAVPLPEVAGLFGDLERIERLAAGAKLRLLRRVDDAEVAVQAGDRSTAEWVARATGTTVGAARELLDTSQRLVTQAATDAAIARGMLSEVQARAVADAVAVDPGAEHALLAAAEREGVRELRDRCAQTKANAHADAAARRHAIHRGRYARMFRDAEGGWNLHARRLPEEGAEFEALLAPFAHARFEAARRVGAHASHEAYRADALLDLARAANAEGSARPKGARRADTKVFVHIDHQTLLGGRTEPGSVCRIEGVGPVDVDWVRSILGEAFATALIEDAVDVRAVVHLGRQVTAHQRSALEARGYRCEVPGCGVTHGLEIDHVTDWHLARTTRLADLVWLCRFHHDQKTHRGYRISGPVGNRTWTAPDGATRTEPPPTADRTESRRPQSATSVLQPRLPIARRPRPSGLAPTAADRIATLFNERFGNPDASSVA
jgi:hypothetical protein